MVFGGSRSLNRVSFSPMLAYYAVLDRRNKSYVIGSLVRLVRVGDHGRQEYKRLVPHDDPKKESITCFSKLTIRSDRTLLRLLRPSC